MKRRSPPMTRVTELKCNVWLGESQYCGVIDISLESALRWWLGALKWSRHWQCVLVRDGGLTVTLDDLSELAELWMGCAAE